MSMSPGPTHVRYQHVSVSINSSTEMLCCAFARGKPGRGKKVKEK